MDTPTPGGAPARGGRAAWAAAPWPGTLLGGELSGSSAAGQRVVWSAPLLAVNSRTHFTAGPPRRTDHCQPRHTMESDDDLFDVFDQPAPKAALEVRPYNSTATRGPIQSTTIRRPIQITAPRRSTSGGRGSRRPRGGGGGGGVEEAQGRGWWQSECRNHCHLPPIRITVAVPYKSLPRVRRLLPEDCRGRRRSVRRGRPSETR